MVTKSKDTQHKKYININVYQTNSPSKLVTSKTFFPLTWSSPHKSITHLEEWHSILKFLPLLTWLSNGVKIKRKRKRKRKRTRTRNHRPTRKRKIKCYGHKDNQKNAKHGKNNACKRISIDQEMARQVSSIIDVDRYSCRGSVDGQINKRLKFFWSIHQGSRSCRGD